MDDASDFWQIVSGGRAESTRQRLERHDRRMSRLYRLLALPLIIGGLTVMLTPNLNTWWNDRTLAHEAHAVETLPQDGIERQVKAARDYNRRMVGRQYQIGEVLNPDGTRNADFTEDATYQRLLDSDASGTMGALLIPAIGVDLPIRHGTGPDALDNGLGHVHGTSLPVGGTDTRTVISGHTNVAGKTLFTRLDELKRGQSFTISVYGHDLHYRIVDIKVIDPSDVDALKIVSGRDLASLLTCTDTANSRRLLVTGERYTPRADEPEDVDAKTGLADAAGIGAVMLAVGLPPIHWTCGRRRVVRHTTDPYRPIE